MMSSLQLFAAEFCGLTNITHRQKSCSVRSTLYDRGKLPSSALTKGLQIVAK